MSEREIIEAIRRLPPPALQRILTEIGKKMARG